MLMLDTEKELYYYGPNKVIGRRNSSTHPLPLPFRYELNLATDASNFLKPLRWFVIKALELFKHRDKI